MAIETINPASGVLIRSYDPLTPEAIEQKLELAADAFMNYRLVSLSHRGMWMRKLAALIDEEVEQIALIMTTEMGKTLESARQEALKCAACCRFYAEHAGEFLTPVPIPTESRQSYVRWDPTGIVLAIMPWNFPFWQVFRFLVPALMAGNVGLLKHAPNVPQCALEIESLVRRAGFPRGVFQALLIENDQIEPIIADWRIAAVTLTGSEKAGKAVAAMAGWHTKKTLLELGGSDPFIVMPSANIEEAAAIAARARCVNNGQSCIAAKRFIVADGVYDDFELRFVANMESLHIGDPLKEETDIGPLASEVALSHLEQQVAAAITAGARVLCGGERMMGDGFYFEPTILADLPQTSSVYYEEFFGPVALLFRVKDIDDAIALANDTPYGLGASVWTTDDGEQQRFIAELDAGAVFVNIMVASDPRLPFGGTKRSGYGRELSVAGMREFMNAKTVVIA